jgi:hypothetical protein
MTRRKSRPGLDAGNVDEDPILAKPRLQALEHAGGLALAITRR